MFRFISLFFYLIGRINNFVKCLKFYQVPKI